MNVNKSKLVFTCDDCSRKFKVKQELAGRRVKCPCGKQLRVPIQRDDAPQLLDSFAEFSSPQLGKPLAPKKIRSKSKKRNGRELMTLIGGWACVGFAGLLVTLAIINLFVGGFDVRSFVGILTISSFPVLLAVACLVPKYRHITVRIVGGVLCAVFIAGYLFAMNDEDANESLAKKGVLITMAIAMAGVAIKGRWPFGESKA